MSYPELGIYKYRPEVPFPYKHLFMPHPQVMFNGLVQYANDSTNHIFYRHGHRLHVIYRSFPEQSMTIDRLADHYTEKQRMCATYKSRTFKSPIETWNMWSNDYKYSKSPYELSEELYHKSGMANGFNPCILITVIKHYGIRSIFDPCMGWGDRLISSYACGIDKYVGFDTNESLLPCYKNIVADMELYNYANMNGTGMGVEFFMEAFEKSPSEWYENDGKYYHQFDAVATSPPFFDIEIYDGKDSSTNLYNTREMWYEHFYKQLLLRCQNVVKPCGYIFLYIPSDMLPFTKACLTSMKFIGIVGFCQVTSYGNGSYPSKSKIRDLCIFHKNQLE